MVLIDFNSLLVTEGQRKLEIERLKRKRKAEGDYDEKEVFE